MKITLGSNVTIGSKRYAVGDTVEADDRLQAKLKKFGISFKVSGGATEAQAVAAEVLPSVAATDSNGKGKTGLFKGLGG